MVGIVIGTMSVILMLSLGEAAQRFILGQVASFGSDVVYVRNGASVEQGQPTLFIKESLTMKDVRKLEAQPWVANIAGVVRRSDIVSANGFDTDVQVVGTMPDELVLSDVRPSAGAFFDVSSVDGRARVAVLGHEIADKAFGAEEPVGKLVKISGQSFRVIGVMEPGGTKGFQNVDKQVYVPVTAAMDLFNLNYVNSITLKMAGLTLPDAKDRITVLLRERHDIDNPDNDLAKDDFHVQTQEDLVANAAQISTILQILLTSIAAISLLVGGIGIMNIMYVTVTERIKEIGLRKAIGALQADVLKQFLVEAVFLTSIGGAIGTALGVALAWIGIQIVAHFQGGWTFAVSGRGVGLGLGVSAAIGLVFGYFPAKKAAGLPPIVALRSES